MMLYVTIKFLDQPFCVNDFIVAPIYKSKADKKQALSLCDPRYISQSLKLPEAINIASAHSPQK